MSPQVFRERTAPRLLKKSFQLHVAATPSSKILAIGISQRPDQRIAILRPSLSILITVRLSRPGCLAIVFIPFVESYRASSNPIQLRPLDSVTNIALRFPVLSAAARAISRTWEFVRFPAPSYSAQGK